MRVRVEDRKVDESVTHVGYGSVKEERSTGANETREAGLYRRCRTLRTSHGQGRPEVGVGTVWSGVYWSIRALGERTYEDHTDGVEEVM